MSNSVQVASHFLNKSFDARVGDGAPRRFSAAQVSAVQAQHSAQPPVSSETNSVAFTEAVRLIRPETNSSLGDVKDFAKESFTRLSFTRLWGYQPNNSGGQSTDKLLVALAEIVQGIGILSSSQGSGQQQTNAALFFAAESLMPSFTGNINLPETIDGISVVGSAATEAGAAGFLLEDGSVLGQDFLSNRANAASVLQALAIATSDASTEDKALALGSLGVQAANINGVLDDVAAGNIGAVLGAIQLATNFDELNSGQQIASISQTSVLVGNALANAGVISSSAASSIAGALNPLGAISGVVLGADQAADVFDAVSEQPQSQAVKNGALGLGLAGASIGSGIGIGVAIATGAAIGSSVPVVGTAIGALVGAAVGVLAGSLGSGKSSSQIIRDNWRDGLEQIGIAKKINGSHRLQLADGTLYDIGRDGGSKLQNIDGTERYTFDVDWGNKIATNSIPSAHLFAIATGFDPSASKFDAFNRIVAQSLNAATSNASTLKQVNGNFRALLEQGGIDAQQLGLQVEVLRQSAKITEGEYIVYVDTLNKIFGTQFAPSNNVASRDFILQQLTSRGEQISAGDLQLLELLTSPEKLNAASESLEQRIKRDAENETGSSM